MLVVSRIGTWRSRCSIGSKALHTVDVRNETADQCFATVRVTCDGKHIDTENDDKTWTDEERSLDPGEKETFRGDLFFVDRPGSRKLPTKEDVVIELLWRAVGTPDLTLCFKVRHTVEVKRK
jgi:hypothetical protein